MKTKIMIVEDDHSVQLLLSRLFTQHNYHVILCSSGAEALFEINNQLPDLIILDLGLPDMEGFIVLQKIRETYRIPVLILSAREDATEKVRCLDYGPDDYVTKPFNNDELLARVRVLGRRHTQYTDQHNHYRNGDLMIDYNARNVTMKGRPIHLTPMEYKLLVLLSEHTGKVLTYNFILKAVWGHVLDTELPSLRVFMTTLRKKIEEDPKNPSYIQTHLSVGYQMMKQEEN